ncbi:ABC transporter permease [Rhabdothermincola salaria]|uniref:ABC transporter permease n=1 Tax=Rhabdothermincola salaria TaxID=2903142 RepID=UPI001E47F80B|nr:ABC transporter permease [Rhabdothermincola salaria]
MAASTSTATPTAAEPTTADQSAPSPSGPGGRTGAALRSIGSRYGVVFCLVALTLVFSVWMPDTFATASNFQTMVNSQAVLLLLAATATIVLRAGDFDLSIAATMTLSASVAAVLSTNDVALPLVVLASLGVGLVVGIVNGVLVVKADVSSFIVTLGMLTALGGLAYWATDSRVIAGVPDPLRDFARTEVLGFPLSTLYGWVLIGVLWYVYERTPLGRYLLFVGGGRDAARLAGLPVDRLRLGAYLVSGTLAAFVGLVLVGSLGSMDPSIGGQYLLQPFAAAFLGATTLKVGRFNAVGTLVGLYLLTVGITGLQLLGADPWVSSVFNGAALVIAVTLAKLAGRGR